MISISVNKNWRMKRPGISDGLNCGSLPVSVYQTLIDNDRIENPYYGENEYRYRDISCDDYDFRTTFTVDSAVLSHDRVYLRFEGVDTVSEIFVNNIRVGSTDNMFCTYEFDVKDILNSGENKLKVSIKSPIRYIEEKQSARPLWGVDTTIAGYPHIRKAHCMMGWDWGPQLPDMGIWRPVTLIAVNKAEIKSFYVTQDFNEDYSALTLGIEAEINRITNDEITARAELKLSDGRVFEGVMTGGRISFTFPNPELWYPRGYGGQPLNTVTVRLFSGDEELSSKTETIGFRTLGVHRDDEKGIFAITCNGTDIFAMGANFIPLDQIFPYITESRIKSFMESCVGANYNMLRIWGGGYYPDNLMLSECDRLGIILWQDFMFACSAYRMDSVFEKSIRAEFEDNIKRMRNHPCIALWCGNNEIESAWEGWGLPEDNEAKEDYIHIFEEIIPETLERLDPNRFYWPSSPSSGGTCRNGEGVFRNSSSNYKGDQHYWDIWHNFKPLTDFRKYLFPFCSEYGFESLPSIKTIKSFAEEEDFNLCCPVMEAHQKCTAGNEKLLYYIAQMCRYPYDFEKLIYASQLVQSDAIRSDVEHMRRHRGKCMGSLYWQVNDSNPVISWSSLDYYNRPKALHYAASKFYAPVLLSCLEEDTSAVLLNVSNERMTAFGGVIYWRLRDNNAQIITSGKLAVSVPPLSAYDAAVLDFGEYFRTENDKRTKYLEYSLHENGKIVSCGSTIFVRPKAFEFVNPDISVKVSDLGESFVITLGASAYAKSVCLELREADCCFSDNWFDIHGGETVRITVPKDSLSEELSLMEFEDQLGILSCYDLQ